MKNSLRRRPNDPARRALLLLVSVALLGWCPGNLTMVGLAQGETKVRLDPLAAEVQVGGTISVDIVIEDVADLYGVDVRLSFDPALLEVLDADPDTAGVQIQQGAFPAPDFVVKNEADNGAGTIWYAVSQMSPTEAVSGGGVAASISFKGLTEGTSSVAFTYQKIVKRDGEQIPATTQNGQIMVRSAGAAPTSTPTSKPKPTDTPLPTPTLRPSATAPPTEAPTAAPPTVTPTSRPTSALTPTTVSAATKTPQPTPTPTATETSQPTPTSVPPTTVLPTEAPTTAPPTAAPTSRPTSTPTTIPEATETPLSTPTSTSVPTATARLEIAAEETPSSTPFPTVSSSGTSGILANGFPYVVVIFLGATALAAILAIMRLRNQ